MRQAQDSASLGVHRTKCSYNALMTPRRPIVAPSIEPKPAHLAPHFAQQFEDAEVARRYHTRPPYPAEVFHILSGLLPERGRSVLELGCGTGELTLGLRERVEHIDALDPSAAMLEVARARPRADDPRIAWFESRAESFAFPRRYSLIVAADSLHWMDWVELFPRLRTGLAPRGVLALVAGRALDRPVWDLALHELIRRYSTNRDYVAYNLIDELCARALFQVLGRRLTEPMRFAQTLDEYVESFHTRNGFLRARMTQNAASGFDAALRRLVLEHQSSGNVEGTTTASVVWGYPLVPRTPANL
jgi:trans-aconitate methyltransferase